MNRIQYLRFTVAVVVFVSLASAVGVSLLRSSAGG
jgi:hypothetical protein